MITHNIKWFLCLSAAAHATVLTAWQLPAYMPGTSGRAVHLSITQRSGDSIEPPSAPTGAAARPAVEETPPPQQAAVSAARVASNIAVARDTAASPEMSSAQQDPSAAQPVTTVATSAAAASSDISRQQETDRHIRNSVMQLISRELSYPAIARRKGWQGVVKLNLHIEPDGSITGLRVYETSGYVILDESAMECLQLASIPGAARWLQGQTIDIVVPVEYRLVDS